MPDPHDRMHSWRDLRIWGSHFPLWPLSGASSSLHSPSLWPHETLVLDKVTVKCLSSFSAELRRQNIWVIRRQCVKSTAQKEFQQMLCRYKGVFCLVCAGGASCDTWDDNASVFVPPLHGFVSSISNGKQVWRPLVELTALVLFYDVPAVYVHGTVRVDRHHHLADVGVDPPLLKPEEYKKIICYS